MKIESALLAVVVSATCISQEIKSTLVYEIKENEKVIHQNEHRMSFAGGKQGYLLFTERYENEDTNQYMVRNGVESGPYDGIYDPEVAWNYSETGFYWFVFYKDGKSYMNMNGTSYGPYDEIGPRGGWYHPIIEEDGQFIFTFARGDKSGYNVNGKEYGPYDEIFDYYTTYDYDSKLGMNGTFIVRYNNEENIFFNVSGQIFGPYDELDTYYDLETDVFASGHYVFKARRDGLEYAVADGKQYGPYVAVANLDSDPDGGTCFSYLAEDGSYFYHLNGKEFGPFDNVETVSVDPVFSAKYTDDGQWFLNVNGKIYGPHQYIDNVEINSPESGLKTTFTSQEGEDLFINYGDDTFGPYVPGEFYDFEQNPEGGYAYVTQNKNDNQVYVIVNGKSFGPVDGSFASVSICLNGKDNFMFDYLNPSDGGTYVNVCGKDCGPYYSVEDYNMNVISPDNYFFRYSVGDQWYVNHSEKIYGPYSSVYLFTVKDKPWFIAENKKGYFTLLNGQESGPFENIWWTTEESRDKGIFYYTQKKKRYKVENGVVALDLDESKSGADDWESVGEYGFDEELRFSYERGLVVYKGRTYDGAAKNAFNFYFDSSTDTFHWFALKGNQLWSHSLK